MNVATLEGGFVDAPRDAAFAFRKIMNVMAKPGTIETVAGATPPAPLSQAAGTVLLTLADADTPIYLAGKADTQEVRGWLAFHTGAPFAGPSHATFAVGHWQDLLPLGRFPIGTPECPDRSATLIVEVDVLEASGARLTGPGVKTSTDLSLPDEDEMAANNLLFPLGLDFYLTCGGRIAALPRSTRIG